jgi:hypothetical protein
MNVEDISFKKEVRSLLREINHFVTNSEKKDDDFHEEWDDSHEQTGETKMKSFVSEPINMGAMKLGSANIGTTANQKYITSGEL